VIGQKDTGSDITKGCAVAARDYPAVVRGLPMSLDELRATLVALAPGKCAGIHHDVYAELFPPGEPDENARAACSRSQSRSVAG
jgi:hypothetical protein